MIITRLASLTFLCVAVSAVAAPAAADQHYSISGSDRYQIGAAQLQTHIDYRGSETLTITRAARGATRYLAKASYRRSDQSGAQTEGARFDALMSPSGEQTDQQNADPNYLTVLNQPFSVALDAATLRDLARLRGRVPFDFPSPMTGGTLHGYLSRGEESMVAGRRAIGVRFEATGPMRGPVPDHPAMALNGTIRMNGVAYYDLGSALLLALDATLNITGSLAERSTGNPTPVLIVYKRAIRAEGGTPSLKEASAAKP